MHPIQHLTRQLAASQQLMDPLLRHPQQLSSRPNRHPLHTDNSHSTLPSSTQTAATRAAQPTASEAIPEVCCRPDPRNTPHSLQPPPLLSSTTFSTPFPFTIVNSFPHLNIFSDGSTKGPTNAPKTVNHTRPRQPRPPQNADLHTRNARLQPRPPPFGAPADRGGRVPTAGRGGCRPQATCRLRRRPRE